jgi:hypothetical protein
MPGKLNGILRLHFCQWTDAETAWMTRELLEPCSPISTRPSTTASVRLCDQHGTRDRRPWA